MVNILDSLNKEQKEAVLTIEGPLLVLAGAGTGKTKVIVSRIAWMIQSGIAPENIVAVSFTNKAAKEMRDRLKSYVGESHAKKVELSTFHSFALKILRLYSKEFGISKHFSIADESESLTLLKEAILENQFQDILSLSKAKELISNYKDQLLQVEDLKKSPDMIKKVIMSVVFDSYQRKLALYNLIDFDDIVYFSTRGLLKEKAVLEKIATQYRYIMVDEYQDTSYSQFCFVKLIGQKYKNVCVVGDDDQSIYSWRGAKPSIISDFLEFFSTSKKVTLSQNYRCSPNILNSANAVISTNKQRLGKVLWSQEPNEYPVHIHACETEFEEAEFVAEKILNFLSAKTHMGSQIAILYRSSAQAQIIEQTFLSKRIKYHINSGNEFLNRKEIKDLFSYIKFAHNQDLKSLFRIINLSTNSAGRSIGLQTLEKIKSAHLEHKDEDILSLLGKKFSAHKGVSSFLSDWEKHSTPLKNATNPQTISQGLKICFEQMGLKSDILLSSSSRESAQYKIERCLKTIEMMNHLELKTNSLEEVIDHFHLDESQYESAKNNLDEVQLMTIHASKGLEFPCVFLIGVEDGILPHEKSLGTSVGEEEECRLFYVAITRAKQVLYISHCATRKQKHLNNMEKDKKPSRFLNHIPNHLTKLTASDPSVEEMKKNEIAQKLFSLFK